MFRRKTAATRMNKLNLKVVETYSLDGEKVSKLVILGFMDGSEFWSYSFDATEQDREELKKKVEKVRSENTRIKHQNEEEIEFGVLKGDEVATDNSLVEKENKWKN